MSSDFGTCFILLWYFSTSIYFIAVSFSIGFYIHVHIHSLVARDLRWSTGHKWFSMLSLITHNVICFMAEWRFPTMWSTTAVQIWIISYIYFTSFHCMGRYELNKLTSLLMCGFTAQLVEHRTGIAEITDLNPVEALFFFQASFQLLNLENVLCWSLFTFVYNRSSNMNDFIYTSQLLFSFSRMATLT